MNTEEMQARIQELEARNRVLSRELEVAHIHLRSLGAGMQAYKESMERTIEEVYPNRTPVNPIPDTALGIVAGIYQQDPNFGKVYVVNRGIEITTTRPEFDDMILGEFDSLQEAEAFVFKDTTSLDDL